MEYKITRNENFNSYEIAFDGKPSEQVMAWTARTDQVRRVQMARTARHLVRL